MALHQATFLPHKKSGFFEEGTTIRDAALELGVLIESDCAGLGACGQCKVNIKDGVAGETRVEREVLTKQEIDQGVRLACQAQLTSACLCIVPPASQSFLTEIMTVGQTGTQQLDPDIRRVSWDVPVPELGEKHFDFEAMRRDLENRGHTINDYEFQVVRDFARLSSEEKQLAVVIDQMKLIAVEHPSRENALYGAAFDIGTTTVAAKLINLSTDEVLAVASAANPQSAHGADVVTRIRYIIDHPGGQKKLNRLIINLINGLINELATLAQIKQSDIYKLTVAGNTVMQHIFLNLNPRKLASSPYTPVFQGPANLSARTLGIEINPNGIVYVLPNLACFVGSDITGVLTVLDLDSTDDMQLAVDLGTNGEIVLGNNQRMICCSSPAGPAWEGACIGWGMRASHGAIERAKIEDGELWIRTIGAADPIGICGSGLIDLIAEFRRAGIIDPTGRILVPAALADSRLSWLREFVIPRSNGVNDLMVAQIDQDKRIILSQNDIREVQLAKSAIATGIRLLLLEFGLEPSEITRVYIAGAFGNHVHGKDVVDLGIIPDIPSDKIHFVGNAALSGAEAVLRSREARMKAERIAERIEYIEIADRAEFQDCFVDEMHFADLNNI